jgi:hypothetical protein
MIKAPAHLYPFLRSRAVASRRRLLFGARAGRSTVAVIDDGHREAPPTTRVHMEATEAVGDLRPLSILMSHDQLLLELWGPMYVRETQYFRDHAPRHYG